MTIRAIAGVDIETTGLNQADGDRIIEFAARIYDFDTFKYLGKYVQRINPQRPISEKAQAVHKITFAELAGEPTIEQVAPKIAQVLSKCPLIVAHNGAGFDFPFLVGELLRIGSPVPQFTGFDTMLHGRWATPNGKLPSVEELCFCFDIEYDITASHAADYDAEVMMRCFFEGLKQGVYTIPEGVYK